MVGCGESAALVDEVKTVRAIIDDTVEGFWADVERLARMLQGAATCRDSRQLRRRERGDGRGDVCEKATPVGVLRGRRRRVVHIHRFVVTHEGGAAAEGTPFDQCYRVRRRNGPRLRHRPVGDGMPTLCRGIPLAVSAQDSAFRKGVLDIDSRASNSHNIGTGRGLTSTATPEGRTSAQGFVSARRALAIQTARWHVSISAVDPGRFDRAHLTISVGAAHVTKG
jgi:hypothetical protein